MGKNYNKKIAKKQAAAQAKEKIEARNAKTKTIGTLTLKFALLLMLAVLTVIYTDKKGYFLPNQTNSHTDGKWSAFYEFTKHNNVDVVMVGTSHLFTGIDPNQLSTALGCNCFVLAAPATTIMDSYYCLKEALTQTHPKIAIIETYGISNTENHHLDTSGLINQFQSFGARKNVIQKLTSMPMLFAAEDYLPAWSRTLRNHNYIFRDTAQLHANIASKSQKFSLGNSQPYLGRFFRFTTGLTDSIINLYDIQGAPVDGRERTVNDENAKYVEKIIHLCQKNGVTPIFLTIPMYYKHINNYETWHNEVAKTIRPSGCYWLDLQANYDTTIYDRDCFENTYGKNQHLTSTGAIRSTYKLLNYMHDSVRVDLPDRSNDDQWIQLFHNEDGFFINRPLYKEDSTHILLAHNQRISGLLVKQCVYVIEKDSQKIFLQIDKSSIPFEDRHKQLCLNTTGTIKGHTGEIVFKLASKDLDPIEHYAYCTTFKEDVTINSITSIAHTGQ
ncbi:MAG: hypothetical protein K6E93_06230 [Bacteroidales bacterium]|nr:hypothetical protein [Bacteroidales bacterium]